MIHLPRPISLQDRIPQRRIPCAKERCHLLRRRQYSHLRKSQRTPRRRSWASLLITLLSVTSLFSKRSVQVCAGYYDCPGHTSYLLLLTCLLVKPLGTFARVWLVRLAHLPEDKTQIYALKILRKADGEYSLFCDSHSLWWRRIIHG